MAVVRRYVSRRAHHLIWAASFIPLALAFEHLPGGAFQGSTGLALRVGLAGIAVVTAVILVAFGYMTRVRSDYNALTRQLQEADELQRVSSRVTSAETTQRAAESVLCALRQQYPFTMAAIVLAGADGQETGWRMNGCLESRVAEPLLWTENAGRSVDGQMGGEGRKGIDPTLILPGCVSITETPLALPGGACSASLIMGFEHPRQLRPDDLRWLNVFARGMALPMERVRMQEELARMAYGDSMTGLANYRAFRRQLHEESGRAARYGHPLSLLILDIDRFKRVNDEYGHPAGDALLRHVGTVLQSHVRAIDFPARYGGEEFAVLCPETEIEAALVLAERLRTAVEDSPCTLPTGETLRITVSVGASVLSGGASSETELVAQADGALYEAKRKGRNRVTRALPVPGPALECAAA